MLRQFRQISNLHVVKILKKTQTYSVEGCSMSVKGCDLIPQDLLLLEAS
jgi:hypothetical protein